MDRRASTGKYRSSESKSDLPAAGPCILGPSVPNIAPDDQWKRKSDREEQKRKTFRKGSKAHPKGDLNGFRITAEHFKQRLNMDQEEAGGLGATEDGGERERSGSKNGRPRRPQQAQLASATQEASQISSNESVPDKTSARNIARRTY
ncbi:hypothetical protein EHS25_005743 [Saitozyma podzolica]|uniref:Uncharacterized protein n=1 Tax=Saitozyma podzolica TaxID=1890683 RepID=A0A427XW30_9TREE|nr:hypothetical protein EHS25_005743 [Saitozyma podzolica]